MKKIISLLIVLFLFSGFSISQVGETELTRTTQEQKENWEKARKEAVEKREAILKEKAKEIDKIYKDRGLFEGIPIWVPDKNVEKLIPMAKRFYKQQKKFDEELKIFKTTTSVTIPIKSYIMRILESRKLKIDNSFNDYFPHQKPPFRMYYSKIEKLVNEIKKFRKLKTRFVKEFGDLPVEKISIPAASYIETVLKNEKLSIKEFFQKMAANGRIVKSEVKKLNKKIKQFDKLKKKLKKGLKISKEITVEIPEDWQRIYRIGFISTLVHFRDNKKEEIRTIAAKWTGQDTKIVKANRYDSFRWFFAFVIGLVIFFVCVIFLSEKTDIKQKIGLWMSVAIGLAVGIYYFFLW